MSEGPIREHAVVVPTVAGPAGAVVSEPRGGRRGALVLLHGLGPSARAGVNAIWTRIARDLAALGLVVLRFDFACEGDSTLVGTEVPQDIGWRRSTDLVLLRDVVPWFLERVGEQELLLAGSCHGGRIALEFAASDPAARGLFLVVPYLWHREPHLRDLQADAESEEPEPVWANGPTLNSDAEIVDGFRTVLGRGPVWVLAGEGEDEQVLPFARRLEGIERPLELRVAPGMPLHPVGHPEQQARVRRLLVERVAKALAEREQAVPSLP
jgi:dienelactone hydrolase